MTKKDRFVIYGGTNHHDFDYTVISEVNRQLGLDLKFSHFWHNTFPDGEPASFPSDRTEITGHHAIVCGCPIDYKSETQLRDTINACHQFGAKSICAVLSFLRYRRQDRPEKEREITRLRWFIRDLAAWGVQDLIVCDPHCLENTQKYCDEFGLKLWVADPAKYIAAALSPLMKDDDNGEFCIYAPDIGAMHRADRLAEILDLRVLLTPKLRTPDGRVRRLTGDEVPADIRHNCGGRVSILTDELNAARGKNLIICDDEIATGGTCVMTARELKRAGATSVHLVITHPVCVPDWKLVLFPPGNDNPFETVWFGNTRPRGNETKYEGSTGARVQKIDLAPAIASKLIQVIKTR